MKFSRREFLKGAFGGGIALIFFSPFGCKKRDISETDVAPRLKGRPRSPGEFKDLASVVAVASGKDQRANTKAVVDALGGMSRFIRQGDVVLVKPNIAWNRPVDYGANTDPFVVAAVVSASLEAGAREVRVSDRTCEDPRRTYKRSGIAEAARAAGAKVYYVVEDYRYRDISIPEGKLLKSWPFLSDALDADVFINLPAAKHHDAAGLTLAMKNLMGILGGDRGDIHAGIHDKLVDINLAFRPTLNILDATRCIVAHGPQGSGPEDVVKVGKVFASVNPVSLDAYAAQVLPFRNMENLPEYLLNAKSRGLGEIDISKMTVISEPVPS